MHCRELCGKSPPESQQLPFLETYYVDQFKFASDLSLVDGMKIYSENEHTTAEN